MSRQYTTSYKSEFVMNDGDNCNQKALNIVRVFTDSLNVHRHLRFFIKPDELDFHVKLGCKILRKGRDYVYIEQYQPISFESLKIIMAIVKEIIESETKL